MNFLKLNLGMLNEAIALRGDLKAGKISAESYFAQMGGISQIGKMQDRHLRMIRFEKDFKLSLKDVGPEMIGYRPELEVLKCPDQEKEITRSDCLDYSGTQTETCQSCENFGVTKNLITPRE